MSVAVDAGRSRCRVVWADGGVPGPPITVPSPATLVDPEGARLIAGAVITAVAELITDGDAGPAGTPLVVAAAGAMSRRDAAARLAERLARDWPGPVAVTSDLVAAHAGTLAGRPGVVLAVGTGAAAIALDSGGETALVDGGGYLVGDAGSGFAVGRAGLDAALRHADGRPGGSAALAAAAQQRFDPGSPVGGPDGGSLQPVVAALHGAAAPARSVASFATDVAAVARAGDPVANAVWREAVTQLADTVNAALGRRPSGEVVLVGTLFEADDLLTTPLRDRLIGDHPDLTVRVAATDTLAGAAWLANHPAGDYESLVVRAGGTRRIDQRSAIFEEGR